MPSLYTQSKAFAREALVPPVHLHYWTVLARNCEANRCVDANNNKFLQHSHAKLYRWLPTKHGKLFVVREHRQKRPKKTNSQKWQSCSNGKVNASLYMRRITEILHGNNDQYQEQDVDDQEYDDSGFEELLSTRDARCGSICLVDTTYNAEDQGDHSRKLGELDDAASARVCGGAFGDHTNNASTWTSCWKIHGLSADMIWYFIGSGKN